MFRFDFYCKKCGYEGEYILKQSSDKVECPQCGQGLEKAAGGCNISIGKTNREDNPEEISTMLGRAERIASIGFKSGESELRINLYAQRNPRLGDPEMN